MTAGSCFSIGFARDSVDHLHQPLGDRALLRQRIDDDIDRQLQLARRVPAPYVVGPTLTE